MLLGVLWAVFVVTRVWHALEACVVDGVRVRGVLVCLRMSVCLLVGAGLDPVKQADPPNGGSLWISVLVRCGLGFACVGVWACAHVCLLVGAGLGPAK